MIIKTENFFTPQRWENSGQRWCSNPSESAKTLAQRTPSAL